MERKLKGGFLGGERAEPTLEERPLPTTVPTPSAAALLRETLDNLERGASATDLVEESDFLMTKREFVTRTAKLKVWPAQSA